MPRDKLDEVRQRLAAQGMALPPGLRLVPAIGGPRPQGQSERPPPQTHVNELRERIARELFFHTAEKFLGGEPSLMSALVGGTAEDRQRWGEARRMAFRSAAMCCFEAADEFMSQAQVWWYECPGWVHPKNEPKPEEGGQER